MSRLYWICLLAILFLAGACSPRDEDPVPVTRQQDASAESWQEDWSDKGREVYQSACADCHDPGQGDAPDTGEPGDWSGRSQLWVAVLSEHATAGYLAMPEKGGHGNITEEQVQAAVEYMMMETFPEKQRD